MASLFIKSKKQGLCLLTNSFLKKTCEEQSIIPLASHILIVLSPEAVTSRSGLLGCQQS